MQSLAFIAPTAISYIRRIRSRVIIVCGLALTLAWISFLMGFGLFTLMNLVI